ncbi:MAG TPA: L,D-transpeptidase [Bdellovibrionota bacterium]
MKKSFLLALSFFLIPFQFSSAAQRDTIEYLPEGQVELPDVMSPEDIYKDMLQQGLVDESDEAELDAPTASPDDTMTYILVSKSRQHLYVYRYGQLMSGWDWPVSTGTEQLKCPKRARCRIAHTPTGIRHPGVLHWTHYSTVWDNAPMHRAIQFTGGVFLHATYGNNIRNLGNRASGGCIRQHPANAERLYLLVQEMIGKNGRKAVVIQVTED